MQCPWAQGEKNFSNARIIWKFGKVGTRHFQELTWDVSPFSRREVGNCRWRRSAKSRRERGGGIGKSGKKKGKTKELTRPTKKKKSGGGGNQCAREGPILVPKKSSGNKVRKRVGKEEREKKANCQHILLLEDHWKRVLQLGDLAVSQGNKYTLCGVFSGANCCNLLPKDVSSLFMGRCVSLQIIEAQTTKGGGKYFCTGKKRNFLSSAGRSGKMALPSIFLWWRYQRVLCSLCLFYPLKCFRNRQKSNPPFGKKKEPRPASLWIEVKSLPAVKLFWQLWWSQ